MHIKAGRIQDFNITKDKHASLEGKGLITISLDGVVLITFEDMGYHDLKNMKLEIDRFMKIQEDIINASL